MLTVFVFASREHGTVYFNVLSMSPHADKAKDRNCELSHLSVNCLKAWTGTGFRSQLAELETLSRCHLLLVQGVLWCLVDKIIQGKGLTFGLYGGLLMDSFSERVKLLSNLSVLICHLVSGLEFSFVM